jgi:dolichol-phosphate mannosyltransferase
LGLPDKTAPILKEVVGWETLTLEINEIAQTLENSSHSKVVIVPLDLYHIGSEMAFYQQKLLAKGTISKAYPVVGGHVFGMESLMYQYWGSEADLAGKVWILISDNLDSFDIPEVKKHLESGGGIHEIWSRTPLKGTPVKHYFYSVGH